MNARQKGFTLIELLVVIAIIGILAAMLFPVFARARESARKIQCLSNVKNIAMAIQMYLTDYDCFPPGEHSQAVIQYLEDTNGCDEASAQWRATQANPYLRWPVILDEYIKNRDVWRCPSARVVDAFGINPGSNWLQHMIDTWDLCRLWPCSRPYPPGWGGSITDSAVQGACAGAPTGGFDRSIGVDGYLTDLKTSEMEDPVKYMVCSDAGEGPDFTWDTARVAYPDVCRIDHVACDPTCGRDWENCPDTVNCSAGIGVWQIGTDVDYRKSWAKARHLGGSNLGFADGHASWLSSEQILFDGKNLSGYGHGPDRIINLDCCFVPVKQNY